MKSLFFAIGATAVLSACATIDGDYWSRTGLSQETLDRDASACIAPALDAGEDAALFAKNKAKRDTFAHCMHTKGYQLRKFNSSQLHQMNQMSPLQRRHFREALMAEATIGRQVIFIPADPVIAE